MVGFFTDGRTRPSSDQGTRMPDNLAPLYARHLATVRERSDQALALAGFDRLLCRQADA